MKRNLPERISLETLRAAWTREAPYHPEWPGTFEGVIASPLLRGVLVAIVRASLLAYRRRRSRWSGISNKDRAAGEKPEDD